MVFNGYRQATVAAVFETPAKTSFLFDLDGTLVWSTASQPALAWRSALSAEGIEPLDLAHPSQDRHERRLVHQHALARDGIPDRS
jgi:beta-phosphoglucomutase-like phosphatase (HAD superfamily)